MKRIEWVECLQDAIALKKEIYLSLYHYVYEGKLFQQVLNPENHIDDLKNRIIAYANNDIEGVFSIEIIDTKFKASQWKS